MALIIVGLGNPGKEYETTRHNAGRAAVELLERKGDFDDFVENKKVSALVAEGTLEGESVTLVLPETMMNASGKAVAAFVKSPKAAKRLLVIHDDLDLSLGTIKVVTGRGSGGHKGVESVMRAVKTKDFSRIRIGVAPPGKSNQAKKLKDEEKVIRHVLGKWKPAEEAAFKKSLAKAVEAAALFVREGAAAATMFANTR